MCSYTFCLMDLIYVVSNPKLKNIKSSLVIAEEKCNNDLFIINIYPVNKKFKNLLAFFGII